MLKSTKTMDLKPTSKRRNETEGKGKKKRKKEKIEKSEKSDPDDTTIEGNEEIEEVDDEEPDVNDPFKHFEEVLEDSTVDRLGDRTTWKLHNEKVPVLNNITVHRCTQTENSNAGLNIDFDKDPLLFVKKQLLENLPSAAKNIPKDTGEILTPLQKSFYSIISSYRDIYFHQRSTTNGEEFRLCYCLHALNHILKTRSKIVHHNAKLTRRDEVPEEFRDQGLTRPKVLVLVPFKESALRVVKMLIDLITANNKCANIINKKRFQKEFATEGEPVQKARKRPDDYEATFAGNIEETFRLGIGVTKKSLKLYVDFYSADILVTSPVGLRMIIGAEGETGRDFDFLSSIELLILDQSEIFIMQNWSHVLHVISHLHLQPKESHDVDFSRVRMWSLNGWAKFYRQTIILSGVSNPAINAVFNKHCFNYAGKVAVKNPPVKGSISQVVVQLPQVFQSLTASNAAELPNARFQAFVSKILPQYKDSVMSHTMIFIPSYFDFVRVRNYFKREDISFVQICEYSEKGKISRARDLFFHGEKHFLIYTERAHFYNRFVFKGIRHIIFYELPVFPHFYSEMCNMLQSTKTGEEKIDFSCLVLFAPQDVQQLSAVVGKERTSCIVKSNKKAYMFVSGE